MLEIINKEVSAGMARIGFRDTESGGRHRRLAMVSHLSDGGRSAVHPRRARSAEGLRGPSRGGQPRGAAKVILAKAVKALTCRLQGK